MPIAFAELHCMLSSHPILFIMNQSTHTIVFVRHRHTGSFVDKQMTLHCAVVLRRIFSCLRWYQKWAY